MNVFRYGLLAGPGFTRNQHRIFAGRSFYDFAKDLLHFLTESDQFMKANLYGIARRPAAQHTLHLGLHVVDVQRADQHVADTLVHQFDQLIHRRRRGH